MEWMESRDQNFQGVSVWPSGGFLGVFTAMIFIFLVIPLFPGFLAHLALQASFTLLVLSAIYTIINKKMIFTCGFLFIIPFLSLDALSIYENSLFLMMIAYGFSAAFLLYAIIYISKEVFSNTRIDTNIIFGAITIYLLAGVLWGKIFFLIDCFFPGSFHGINSLDIWHDDLYSGYETQFNLLYYSCTTITSLGVGDITPLHHLAKSLTMLEAVFGQLFVATALAKLVSIWRG